MRDHEFTAEQRIQYDSLNHHGRTEYDRARLHGSTHAEAYALALKAPGAALKTPAPLP
jgi:hypothetical protein